MSAFVWLDYSERERRKMLDVVDLFREHDTVGSPRIRGLWFGNIRRKVGIASVAGAVSTLPDGPWPRVAGKGSTSRRSTVVKYAMRSHVLQR